MANSDPELSDSANRLLAESKSRPIESITISEMSTRPEDPAIRDQRLDDHDQRKTRSRTRSRNEEMDHFLQITIARKNGPFLKKTLYNFS